MSNPYEPTMTRSYWASRPEAGTLHLGFPIHGRRIDGLAVLDDDGNAKHVNHAGPYPSVKELRGRRVIVLQTKRIRLGMNLSGQAIIAKTLLEMEGICVVASVAICL